MRPDMRKGGSVSAPPKVNVLHAWRGLRKPKSRERFPSFGGPELEATDVLVVVAFGQSPANNKNDRYLVAGH